MKLGIAVLTFAAFPLSATASPADAVLRAVVPQVEHIVVTYGVAPAAWSATTRGGAAHFADEFVYSHLNAPVAGELADAYYNDNLTEHAIADLEPANALTADVHPFQTANTFDWSLLQRSYPRVRSVVVLSEPAFDAEGADALVRYDVISPKGAWTGFVELEKQPLDGSWKEKFGALGTREAFYRTDGHPGHMPDHCPVPPDKRHS